MKFMGAIHWFGLGLISSLLALSAAFPANADPAAEKGYRQTYAILVKGMVAGSEVVTETTDEAGELVSSSEHEMLITDGLETKRMAYSTKMILAKGTFDPLYYSYKFLGGETGDSYDVTVKGAQIKRVLTRNGRTSEVTVPAVPDMVILDFSVYHQYDYLVKKYDTKKGGRQLFANFVPLIGDDIPIALTLLGTEESGPRNVALPISSYKMEFVGKMNGTVWVDQKGRLVRLLLPVQDLEVVRKDLLPPETKP
jgi:hypothetical protein